MKKRVFVTGAAGFIGFHSALCLGQRGDVVLGYDNFNDYYDPHLKRLRAAELAKLGIGIVEGDLCDRNLLIETARRFRPSHILHLAAQAGVRYCLSSPHSYVKSNIEGFLSVLELARELGDIPVVYASSSSVYGTNPNLPFTTEDRTDHPANLYGATKKANELMAYSYHHCFGLPVTGLRYFTVYGPWGRPDMAYFSFADAIRTGKPIKLFNQGQMQRDFTYIDDIVEGTMAALDLATGCEVYNLGNSHPSLVTQLIRLLEQGLGKKAILELHPMGQGEVENTHADITKSQTHLNFKPKITLEAGIDRFLRWYQTYAGARETRAAALQ